MKMVKIVSERREKGRLLIKLNHYNPIMKNIPLELTRKTCETLTIVLDKKDPVHEIDDLM